MESWIQGYGVLAIAVATIVIVMLNRRNDKQGFADAVFGNKQMLFHARLPLGKGEDGKVDREAVLSVFNGMLCAMIDYDTDDFNDQDFHLFKRLVYDALREGQTLQTYFNNNEMIFREHQRLFNRNRSLVSEIENLKNDGSVIAKNYQTIEEILSEKNKIIDQSLNQIEKLNSDCKQALDGFEDLRLKYAKDVQSLRDESDSIQVKLNETEEKYQRSRSDVAELSQRISDMQSVTHEQQIKHMHEEGSRLVQIQLDRNAKLQERIRELTDLNTALAERCHGQSEALAGRDMKQFPKEKAEFVEKVKAALPEMFPHDLKIFCDTCKQPLKLVPTKHRHTWHCSVCNPTPVSE